MLKRLVCATLALSLMGATAASARPWNSGHHADRSHYSYSHGDRYGWRGDRHYRNDGAATALGIGLGLFALAAIASRNDDRYYYGPPPPPPPPAYGYYGY
jgi:opacity protein-like surface antigen